jgi:hypothetical protein
MARAGEAVNEEKHFLESYSMGLRWARQPVYKERGATWLNNEDFVIPAGASHHEINANENGWKTNPCLESPTQKE